MKGWKIFVYLLFICHCVLSNDGGVLPAIKQLSTQNGLADNRIKYFFQDSEGLIWLNTRNGLQRYDGTRFFTLSYDPQQPTQSLPSSIMNFGITEDANRFIWAVTEHEGPVRYSPQTGQLEAFNKQISRKDFLRTHTVFRTSRNEILVSSVAGLQEWKEQTFQMYPNRLGKLSPQVFANLRNIMEDGAGSIWVSSSHGFLQLDSLRDFYSSSFNPRDKKILNHSLDISTSMIDRDGFIWYSSWEIKNQERYLYRYDTRKNRLDSVPLPKNTKVDNDFFSIPISMVQDKTDNIWMATLGGHIYLYNNDMQLLQDYSAISIDGNEYDLESIASIFCDKEGNIWVSIGQGVFICRQVNPGFAQELNLQDFKFDYQHAASQVIVAESGSIYLNNRSRGLFHWDLESNRLITLEQNIYPGKWSGYLNFLHSDEDRIFLNPWFSDAVLCFNENRNRFESFIPGGKLGHFDIKSITVDSVHFFTGKSAIYLFNSSGSFIDSIKIGTNHTFICNWATTGDGKIVAIDTGAALYQIDPLHRKWKLIANLSCRGGQYAILSIGNKTLVGTLYEGLKQIGKMGEIERTISTNDGLLSNTIHSLYLDHKGTVWIKTPNGFNYLKPEADQVFTTVLHDKRYNAFSDAYPDSRFGFCFLLKDKIQYFQYVEVKQPDPIPIVFTKIVAGSRYQSTDQKKNHEFNWNEHTLRFEFAALDYAQNASIQYRYKLNNEKEEWIYMGNSGTLVFDQLSPGDYQLQIQYRRLNENWQTEGLSYSFFIHQPLWKKWWIYVGLAILILFPLVYSFQKEKRVAKKMENLRWQLSRDLHDDIGSTLSSIGIYSTVLASKVQDEKGKEIIREIASQSKEMIQNMSDIVWAIQPSNMNAEPLLNRFVRYAEPILASKNSKLEVHASSFCKSIELSVLQKRNLFLFLKEALNNCIKHSSSKRVRINCLLRNRRIFISFEDDGVGFDFLQLSRKNGLQNMENRIKELNGEMLIKTSPGNGTRIEVEIPMI
jgi:signal transduction histidine kinase/sugar lactone lactonase YvrE